MLVQKSDWYINTLLLPCGRSRLLQRRGRVFAFRSCGPGSIPTSGGWSFMHPVTFGGQYVGSTACISGITQQEMSRNYSVVPSRFGDESIKIREICSIINTLLLPCGRSRLLQRRGRVFACRSSGPGSIPTSGG